MLLVVQDTGRYRIESRQGLRWAGADYAPGSMGLTLPGSRSLLRWRPAAGDDRVLDAASGVSTLQVHLSAALVAETARSLGRRWAPSGDGTLELSAPGVLATARALAEASRTGAPRLAAEALAEALAAQLLAAVPSSAPAGPRAGDHPSRRRRTQPLDAAQVARVVDHLQAHLAEPVGLQECAALVGSSRAHFLRAFSAATGTTPHRYLVQMRLDRAARLLRTTDATVLDIAVACGYSGTSHFAEAFARQHGAPPSRYRAAHLR
ncbi:helix-turn-helix transcriptional regulator [Streptomyces sp. NP160]|uniref:helix-turn-helix domain-containing protein n=1 Tax=Streptomyces sp. NP160 TaxID=2586637 RepID=UPI00111ABB32|nr:AraC family transcriptional regulator [Streptomyces sp. NP160]TNM59810.1 helix-turn-helix transcriptional regulator [Streptomyces sp. NP160]